MREAEVEKVGVHLNSPLKLPWWIYLLHFPEDVYPYISSCDFRQREWHRLCSRIQKWQLLLKATTFNMQLWAAERNLKSLLESYTAKPSKIQGIIWSETKDYFSSLQWLEVECQPKIWLHNHKAYETVWAKAGKSSLLWLLPEAGGFSFLLAFLEQCHYCVLISMQVIS